MALCDELEAQQQKRNDSRIKLTASAVALCLVTVGLAGLAGTFARVLPSPGHRQAPANSASDNTNRTNSTCPERSCFL